MKALITGISGFIGSNLARRLVRDGYDVIGIVRDVSSTHWRLESIKGRIRLIQGDLLDFQCMDGVISSCRPDVIFHLAAYGAYHYQKEIRKILETSVFSTLAIFEAAKKYSVKMVVNAGSSSEYGEKKQPMAEGDVLEPNSYYAVGKASQSLLAQYFSISEDIPIVTLRMFSVYGPFEEPGRYIPTAICNALNNKNMPIANFCTARDFVYINDVVDACVRVSSRNDLGGKIINIGTGLQSTLLDAFQKIISLTDSRSIPIEGAYQGRVFDTNTWVADTNYAQDVLNVNQFCSLNNGLRETIEWLKLNRQYYN